LISCGVEFKITYKSLIIKTEKSSKNQEIVIYSIFV
jgi:hypothetical protein